MGRARLCIRKLVDSKIEFSQTTEAEMADEVIFSEILSNCDSAPSSPIPEVRICVIK